MGTTCTELAERAERVGASPPPRVGSAPEVYDVHWERWTMRFWAWFGCIICRRFNFYKNLRLSVNREKMGFSFSYFSVSYFLYIPYSMKRFSGPVRLPLYSVMEGASTACSLTILLSNQLSS